MKTKKVFEIAYEACKRAQQVFAVDANLGMMGVVTFTTVRALKKYEQYAEAMTVLAELIAKESKDDHTDVGVTEASDARGAGVEHP